MSGQSKPVEIDYGQSFASPSSPQLSDGNKPAGFPPFFLRAFFCPFSFVHKQNEQAEQSEKAEMLDREAAKGIDLSKLVDRIERETAKNKPDHALKEKRFWPHLQACQKYQNYSPRRSGIDISRMA